MAHHIWKICPQCGNEFCEICEMGVCPRCGHLPENGDMAQIMISNAIKSKNNGIGRDNKRGTENA